jgi:hypothetical protein
MLERRLFLFNCEFSKVGPFRILSDICGIWLLYIYVVCSCYYVPLTPILYVHFTYPLHSHHQVGFIKLESIFTCLSHFSLA